HHIEQTILVQAAPTIEETEFLLDLSNKSESIAGVVGWIDLEDSNYRAQFDRFKKHPKFVGFRLMIQDIVDETIVLQERYLEALRYNTDKVVPIDILCVLNQLPIVNRLPEKVPNIRGVVNQIGKPNIDGKVIEPWKSDMRQNAKNKNIHCKLSGMVTEADHK